jgi:transaldolase
MPEATLHALAVHQEFGEAQFDNDETIFSSFAIAGIDTDVVAAQLLDEGVESFAKSWNELLDCIASKSAALKAVVA